jgi:hypothetical protein
MNNAVMKEMISLVIWKLFYGHKIINFSVCDQQIFTPPGFLIILGHFTPLREERGWG